MSQITPSLDQCAGGCGFWGNPIWQNMCSRCYKETLQKNEQKQSDPENNNEQKPEEKTKRDTQTLQAEEIVTKEQAILEQPQSPLRDMNTSPATIISAKSEQDTSSNKTQTQSENSTEHTGSSKESVSSAVNGIKEDEEPTQTNHAKCWSCGSKVPLIKQATNKCRCHFTFCDQHKFPLTEEVAAGTPPKGIKGHICSHDYISSGRNVLSKVVVGAGQKVGGRSFQRI